MKRELKVEDFYGANGRIKTLEEVTSTYYNEKENTLVIHCEDLPYEEGKTIEERIELSPFKEHIKEQIAKHKGCKIEEDYLPLM